MDPVDRIAMSYNSQTNRLEFACPEKKFDFAHLIINQDSTCFEKLEYFFKKYFTRSWIVLKAADGTGTEQLFNINAMIFIKADAKIRY